MERISRSRSRSAGILFPDKRKRRRFDQNTQKRRANRKSLALSARLFLGEKSSRDTDEVTYYGLGVASYGVRRSVGGGGQNSSSTGTFSETSNFSRFISGNPKGSTTTKSSVFNWSIVVSEIQRFPVRLLRSIVNIFSKGWGGEIRENVIYNLRTKVISDYVSYRRTGVDLDDRLRRGHFCCFHDSKQVCLDHPTA